MLEWTKETLFGDKLGHYKTLAFTPFLLRYLVKEKKYIEWIFGNKVFKCEKCLHQKDLTMYECRRCCFQDLE